MINTVHQRLAPIMELIIIKTTAFKVEMMKCSEKHAPVPTCWKHVAGNQIKTSSLLYPSVSTIETPAKIKTKSLKRFQPHILVKRKTKTTCDILVGKLHDNPTVTAKTWNRGKGGSSIRPVAWTMFIQQQYYGTMQIHEENELGRG